MSVVDYKFQGWAGDHTSGDGSLVFEEFDPKPWDEDDVDIKIQYCGICGSDVSALSGEWGPQKPHTVCGHELVGVITRVGHKVENGIKVGDVCGVEAQSDSCRECEPCQQGHEPLCDKGQIITFGAEYARGNGAGYISRGGFATYWRGPSRFAVPLPAGLDPSIAGPLFCGGVTVFAPLDRFGAGTKAKNVGVMGVGGLGHFAIMFAKAMGARVTAISRSDAKKADAEALGATDYIATGDDIAAASKEHAKTLDLIICTINPPEFNVTDYLPLLKPFGTIVFVGVIPKPLELPVFSLIGGSINVTGSLIGSPAEIKKMLQFVVDHDIKPWINKWKMADVNEALVAFKKGDPKYRFVLVNEDS